MSTEPASQVHRPNRDKHSDPAGGFYQPVADDNQARGETLRMIIVAFAIVLFGLTLTVVFVLPRYLPDSANPTSPKPVEETAQTTAPARVAEPDAEATSPPATKIKSANAAEQAADRQAAQDLLGKIDEQIGQLEKQNAAVWAADDFAQARLQLEAGEKAYGEQRYSEATEIYAQVQTILANRHRAGPPNAGTTIIEIHE